jgi:hypothetical protein
VQNNKIAQSPGAEKGLRLSQEPCSASNTEIRAGVVFSPQSESATGVSRKTATPEAHMPAGDDHQKDWQPTLFPSAVETKKAKSKPGLSDWYCPRCCDLQFRKNKLCRICGLSRDHGVTSLQDLDLNEFLKGHCIEPKTEDLFRNLSPRVQQIVMSGGSLHGAREPTAVLCNRMRKAHTLTKTAARRSADQSSPPVLGFDRKRRIPLKEHPGGTAMAKASDAAAAVCGVAAGHHHDVTS